MAARATDEPGGRQPAPEPLRLIQRFVNSNDREGGRDAFATPAALAAWLHGAGLPTGALTEGDRKRVVALREALRALLLANNGAPTDSEALANVNAEIVRTGLVLRLTARAPELEVRGAGLDRVLGRLLAIVFDATVDGSWLRLKACRRDICRWVFYDHSRNRSGTWCAMDVCGNRVKTSAYWRRHHGGRTRRKKEP